MSGLTKDFLSQIGVDMDDETYRAFSEHFDQELHEHIINRIIIQLAPDQVAELTAMQGQDSAAIWDWLQSHVPNHQQIVKQEVDAMLAEVVRSSDHL